MEERMTSEFKAMADGLRELNESKEEHSKEGRSDDTQT